MSETTDQTSCIRHRAKTRFFVLFEDYLDIVAAYQHQYKIAAFLRVLETKTNDRIKYNDDHQIPNTPDNLWIEIPYSEFTRRSLGLYERSSFQIAADECEKLGVSQGKVKQRHMVPNDMDSPEEDYKVYLLNIEVLQAVLDGQSFPVPDKNNTPLLKKTGGIKKKQGGVKKRKPPVEKNIPPVEINSLEVYTEVSNEVLDTKENTIPPDVHTPNISQPAIATAAIAHAPSLSQQIQDFAILPAKERDKVWNAVPVTYQDALDYLKAHGTHERLDASQVMLLARKLYAEAQENDNHSHLEQTQTNGDDHGSPVPAVLPLSAHHGHVDNHSGADLPQPTQVASPTTVGGKATKVTQAKAPAPSQQPLPPTNTLNEQEQAFWELWCSVWFNKDMAPALNETAKKHVAKLTPVVKTQEDLDSLIVYARKQLAESSGVSRKQVYLGNLVSCYNGWKQTQPLPFVPPQPPKPASVMSMAGSDQHTPLRLPVAPRQPQPDRRVRR